MDFLPKAFEALAHYHQFIVYKLVPSRNRPGKNDKLPVNYITGDLVNAHEQKNWLDAETAFNMSKLLGGDHGIGFVFTEADPFFFLDIDDCVVDGKWSDTANALLQSFPGALVEVSSSGKGLHIIGSGKISDHACRNATHKLELYHSGRFVALSGYHVSGSASVDFTPQLEWLVSSYFQSKPKPVEASWTDEPVSQWSGSTDDNELIRRAFSSKSSRAIFGGAARFADLWDANEHVLAAAYPPNDTDVYNRSSADAALAQHLAFWTGNDCERMRRLMLQSGLSREKWEREDYLPRTILGACGRQTEWITNNNSEAIVTDNNSAVNSPVAKARTGNSFLNIEEQIKRFAGCVYVSEDHKVFTPDGRLLDPQRFRASYSGYNHVLDPSNSKTTTDAWKAFVETQAIQCPQVNGTCFRPVYQPGSIIVENGHSMVNTYVPILTRRVKGDATPFFKFMEKLFVDPRDREIILCFMAAIVQFPGIKFRWCPLIQGVQGNGKTTLSLCVKFAIGSRYCHTPKAMELASRFNDWLYGKIFIMVEDVFVADSKMELHEAIKPMISNESHEIEAKGGIKVTKDICANFILNSNHKDGIRKHQDDRRFAPFFTAQQSKECKARDGLTSKFFNNYHNWLRADGFAIVNEVLHTYNICDEFNPATYCLEAPITSSTENAIAEGISPAQSEVLEAIGEGRYGFKGDFISSIKLTQMLDSHRMGRLVPIKKRADMLKQLNYIPHPGLTHGRSTQHIEAEGGKPTLYVKLGTAAIQLTEPAKIINLYKEQQK